MADFDQNNDGHDSDDSFDTIDFENDIPEDDILNSLPEDDAQLEQYGVWVKVEPHDFEDSDIGTEDKDSSMGLADLNDETLDGITPRKDIEEIALDDMVDIEINDKEESGNLDLSQLGGQDTEEFDLDMDMESISDNGHDAEDTDISAKPSNKPVIDTDGELEIEDMSLPTASDSIADIELEDFSDSGTNEELPELELEEKLDGVPVMKADSFADDSLEVELSENVHLDDQMADFESIKPSIKKTVSIEENSLLQKIEKELLSIKSELLELKKELLELRRPHKEHAGVEVQPVSKKKQGFFDDEEDETIALTGDELNNILNTANITEADVSEEAADIGIKESEEIEVTTGENPIVDEIELEEAGQEAGEMTGEDNFLTDDIEAEEDKIDLSMELPEEDLSLELGDEEISLDAGEEIDVTDLAKEETSLPDEGLEGLEGLEDIGTEDETMMELGDEGESLDEAPGLEENLEMEEEIKSDDRDVDLEKELDDAETTSLENGLDMEEEEISLDVPAEKMAIDSGNESKLPEIEEVDFDMEGFGDKDSDKGKSEDKAAGHESTEEEFDFDLPDDDLNLDLDLEDDGKEGSAGLPDLDDDFKNVEEMDINFEDTSSKKNLPVTDEEMPIIPEEDTLGVGSLSGEENLAGEIEGIDDSTLEEAEAIAEVEMEPESSETLELGNTDDLLLEPSSGMDEEIIELDDSSIAEKVSLDEGEETSLPSDEMPPGLPEEETFTLDTATEDLETFATAEGKGDMESLDQMDTLAEEVDLEVTDEGIEALEEVEEEAPRPKKSGTITTKDVAGIPDNLKEELKTVLAYMDKLLESLPEDKIKEFAHSEYFMTYKRLFEELGLVM